MRQILLSLQCASAIFGPVRGWACSCADPSPSNRARMEASAKALFIGRVTHVDRLPSVTVKGHQLRFERARFRVFRAWKGVDNLDVAIDTWIGRSSTCEGYLFEAGTTYLVFTDNDGMLAEGLCSLTRSLSEPLSHEETVRIDSLEKPAKVFDPP